MNGYICFWNRQRVEVRAGSSYEAQQRALELFCKNTRKNVKGHEITVVLAEKNGEQVTHAPTF